MADILSKNPVSRFVHGFLCPFRSLAFIRKNTPLYKFILIPFMINALTFSLVVYFGLGSFYDFVMAKIPTGDAWYWLVLNYFFMALAVLVVLVLVFFTFAAVGSLIASPFNDLLSEKTESLLTGSTNDEPFTLALFVKDAQRTLVVESKKIALFLVGMICLMALHLVPLIGSLLYPVLSILWTIYFLINEYTGYVFSRKRYDFATQRKTVFRHMTVLFGFGTGLFCVLAIPFFQFMCIPLGVVGAVRLLHDVREL